MQSKRALTILLMAGMAVAAHAGPVFQVLPGGTVGDFPGTTVGWGFTITNTTDYLVVTGSQFSPAPFAFFGSYQDLIGTGPLIVLGPSPEPQTLTELFNLSLGTGVGAFHIAATAAGRLDGQLIVDYALFSVDPNDPNFDPDTDLLVADAQLSAPVSVFATPEPASLLLIAPGLFAMFRLRRKRLPVRS
ncbi:MAG: PEP-CTERM sorting domain-containing protein [Candidatus Solibacter sp.]